MEDDATKASTADLASTAPSFPGEPSPAEPSPSDETKPEGDDLDFDVWAHLAAVDVSVNAEELELLERELDEENEAYPGFDHDEDHNSMPDDLDEDYDKIEKEEAEEEGAKEKEEEDVALSNDEASPNREDDVDLSCIPEDQREAVEGNLKLKRVLSLDKALLTNGAAKRMRKDGRVMKAVTSVQNPMVATLLKRWRLQQDSAAAFVLRTADAAILEVMAKSVWQPAPGAQKRTQAEQIYERMTLLKERQGTPGGPLDAAAAFGRRWHLSPEEDEVLAQLDHKCLRHVLKEFDKSRPVAEFAEEAGTLADDSELAVPDELGLYVLGRSQRLELIDPFADALVLGDANLTFSLLFARRRKCLHHSGGIVATTFEKLATLRERYQEIDETIDELQQLGCEVLHNVDCTRLAVDSRFGGMEARFGAVYYNFPHAGVVSGFFDGHPFVRWRHANLMHLFFRALRPFVKAGGIVKVASNSRATGVRFSDIISGAMNSEFVHDETFPFLEWSLSRYRRSYGDRRDEHRRPDDGDVYTSQRANSDMVYCFTYRPSGDPIEPALISYPPTKEELLASNEGKAGRLPVGAVARKKRVDELYELFLSYVQGVHVG